MFIPHNPLGRIGVLPSRGRMNIPPPGLFTTARSALLSYWSYLDRKGLIRRNRIAVPDYMCGDVTLALRKAGISIGFYRLDSNFDIEMDSFNEESKQSDVALIVHFFGRMSRRKDEALKSCESNKVIGIEDCAHLPYPHPVPTDCNQTARIYSLRKTYGFPLGGILLSPRDQRAFAGFVTDNQPEVQSLINHSLLVWYVKQLLKWFFYAINIPVRRSSCDLSQEQVDDESLANPLFRRFLYSDWADVALTRRRKNYLTYTAWRSCFLGLGDCLDFDVSTDVPYKFVITLRHGIHALDLINKLVQHGVPAFPGLSLDPEILDGLDKNHRYHRVLTLPIHQDLGSNAVSSVCRSVGQFSEELRIH
jgi:hypothetical protein